MHFDGHLLGVIKQSTVPQRMVSFGSAVKVSGVRTVKLVQAVQYVFGRVRMDHVQHNVKTFAVRDIH